MVKRTQGTRYTQGRGCARGSEQTLHPGLMSRVKALAFILRLDLKQKCDGIRSSLWETPADGTDCSQGHGHGEHLHGTPVGSRSTDRVRGDLEQCFQPSSHVGITRRSLKNCCRGLTLCRATQDPSGCCYCLLSR